MREGRASELDPRIGEIAEAVRAVGGRALLVGGSVRDRVLDRPTRDIDIEVLGLSEDRFAEILSTFGRFHRMGRSYTVYRLRGLDVDFTVDDRHGTNFEAAATRRDLTMNSMAMDPLSGDILDPHGGRDDLAARRLRATDPASFGIDPLRALRVARFAACLDMEPDAELLELCGSLSLEAVAGERMGAEWERLLVEAPRPSVGLGVLERSGQLEAFPELAALPGVPQDPEWHPEGDVWTHTQRVVDAAARLRCGDTDDHALMLGALCHDFGKPSTTRVEDGRVRSKAHEAAGIEPTQRFLARLRTPGELTTRVCALVAHHLAPAVFVANDAGPRGYRRLARRLQTAGVSIELLARVARADHLGRTTEEARAGRFPAGDTFLEKATALRVEERAPEDVVIGRHVMRRGVPAGPDVGRILDACRTLQDQSGETDPERLLDQVFANLERSTTRD